MDDTATFLSLWWTWPVITLCLAVLAHWIPKAVDDIVKQHKLNGEQWLILGIAVSFIGATVDVIYWGIVWAMEYTKCPLGRTLFIKGVYVNLFFRQICIGYAAFCHLKAYYSLTSKNNHKIVIYPTLWAIVVGFLITMFLTLLRNTH